MNTRRAGVFIGVDRTGNLPPLHDAAQGARSMYEWALEQGMRPETHAHLLIDEEDRVTPDHVFDAVQSIVDGPGVDQLILYFAGHGTVNNDREMWLLSDAPVRASAAVDVNASLEVAQYSNIEHVVAISDACRVPPAGTQAQRVRGQVIFPNEASSERARTIDRYFACRRDRAAAEVRGEAGYRAVYTSVLLDALHGHATQVLEHAGVPEADSDYVVRGRRLKEYLERAVPEKIAALGLHDLEQDPDAILQGGELWLSRVRWSRRGDIELAEVIPPRPPNLRDVASSLIAAALTGTGSPRASWADDARPILGKDELVRAVENLAAPVDRPQLTSRCGARVRGRRVLDVLASGVPATVRDCRRGDGQVIELALDDARPGVPVLVRLDGEAGTLVPMIRDVITTLTFDASGALVDVAFDAAPGGRFDLLQEAEVSQAAHLRAATAVAADFGVLRPDEQVLAMLVEASMVGRPVDAAQAVYTAYACSEVGRSFEPNRLAQRFAATLGTTFLDLKLLARSPISPHDVLTGQVLPGLPLLSRGWPVVRGRGLHLVSDQESVAAGLLESQWSLYDRTACDALARAMARGEL